MATPALALNPERHYELVSPPFKAGYGATDIQAVAPDGDSAAFASVGKFAGSDSADALQFYLARRDPVSGWSTGSIQPPATLVGGAIFSDFSSSLGSTLATAELIGTAAAANSDEANEKEFLLHDNETPDSSSSWERLGGIVLKRIDGKRPGIAESGASADLCHVIIKHGEAPLETFPVSGEARGASAQSYELVQGCHGEAPALRLFALNNNGKPINLECGSLGGGGTSNSGSVVPGETLRNKESLFNAISGDGSEIFFTPRAVGALCLGAPRQLFVRLGGERTLEVSKPLSEAEACKTKIPCPGATTRAPAIFEGASEDGSRVFFTTAAPLDQAEDTDESNDLYVATIGCAQANPQCKPSEREVTGLALASKHGGGEPADVQGVVNIAQNGSRAYFVATGDLLSQSERAARQSDGLAVPQTGADNLYVYDVAAGRVAFVAGLCSGPQESGSAGDAECPADLEVGAQRTGKNDENLWQFESPYAQSTDDGGYLVFDTYARLVAEGPEADTDNAQDVYRYDAQTGVLARVSVGVAGHSANGNELDERGLDANAIIQPFPGNGAALQNLNEYERGMSSRAISEDGARIVFETAEPLSPDAKNGLSNLYEWHEGNVSLISGGNATQPVEDAVMTPSGDDVFFVTSQSLLAQDTDEQPDVYDARLGGGFAEGFAEREECAGDACQGPLTNPAPLLVPGSVSQAPGGNLPAPRAKAVGKKKLKKKTPPKSHSKSKKKHGARRVVAGARHGGSTHGGGQR
jgi:hypothetical protein